MLTFLVFGLWLLSRVSGRPHDEVQPLVLGGSPAKENSFPYVVSIRYSGSLETFCGGCLITDRFVLTAGHCDPEGQRIVVGVGSVELSKQDLYTTEEFISFPSYDPLTAHNDIGLYKLEKSLTLSPRVQLVNFPYLKNEDNQAVTAVGWGRTSEGEETTNTLLYLKKYTLTNEECRQRGSFTEDQVIAGNVCLNSSLNAGVCFGDSGSPLVLEEDGKPYVVGVVSWGVPCAVGSPDVFTRVSYYAKWVKEVVES